MNTKIIPYGRQSIEKDDIDAVVNTLQSDFLTQGPKINEFEKALEDFSNNIKLQPKNFLSYRNRAICKSLVGRGDYCSDYKRACQLGDKDSCDKCL